MSGIEWLVDVTVGNDMGSARRARWFFAEVLAAHGWDDDRSYDACLVVSDLIVHAIEQGDGVAGCRATITDDCVRFAVADRRGVLPLVPPDPPAAAAPADPTGATRLPFVEELSSAWGIEPVGPQRDGTVVWAEVARHREVIDLTLPDVIDLRDGVDSPLAGPAAPSAAPPARVSVPACLVLP